MNEKFFILRVRIPRTVALPSHEVFERPQFFEYLWNKLGQSGLLGVHEGTVLSNQTHLDSAQPPTDRDWIGDQEQEEAELYFEKIEQAKQAQDWLHSVTGVNVIEIRTQESEDWNAKWRESFLGNEVLPHWLIVPPWRRDDPRLKDYASNEQIWINPGAGFGTGTHETTQLCLKALSEWNQLCPLMGQTVLDFGSGSGILAIGAKKLGALRVDGVEVDPLALDNARENSSLNFDTLVDRQGLSFMSELPKSIEYHVIVANILRPVLLDYAETLVSRLRSGGALFLSGLLEQDLPEVIARYNQLLGTTPYQTQSMGDWRLLGWKKEASPAEILDLKT